MLRETGAFLEWLSSRPEVKGAKVGVTGYCMGGADEDHVFPPSRRIGCATP